MASTQTVPGFRGVPVREAFVPDEYNRQVYFDGKGAVVYLDENDAEHLSTVGLSLLGGVDLLALAQEILRATGTPVIGLTNGDYVAWIGARSVSREYPGLVHDAKGRLFLAGECVAHFDSKSRDVLLTDSGAALPDAQALRNVLRQADFSMFP